MAKRVVSGLALGLVAGLSGCGYSPAYQAGAHYAVVAGAMRTSQFEATQPLLSGVRTELAAAATGAGTTEYPRVEVELLRVDERSIGVQQSELAAGPLARGSEIVVVGRARVFDAPAATPSVDTGDMSRAVQYASGVSPVADGAARSRAVRDAARSLGRALGRAVLGFPEPADG